MKPEKLVAQIRQTKECRDRAIKQKRCRRQHELEQQLLKLTTLALQHCNRQNRRRVA
jgi:hypothetical protein